jgi:hypothetical protein
VTFAVRYLRDLERGPFLTLLRKSLKSLMRPIIKLDFVFSSTKPIYRNLQWDQDAGRIFVFIKHGKMDKFDMQILEFFRDKDFFTLLFSTEYEDSIYADQWQKKRLFGRDSSILRDVSRTFGNIETHELELAIFNDSMVWDEMEMPNLLAKLRSYPKNTIVFPTESMYPVSHVQPYFVYANMDKRTLQKYSVSFEWIKTYHLKRSMVQFVEYLMRDTLENAGWLVEVVAKHKQLVTSAGKKVTDEFNPTQHLWKSLPKCGIVGIKRSLVNTNPVNVIDAPRNFEDAIKNLREKLLEVENQFPSGS